MDYLLSYEKKKQNAIYKQRDYTFYMVPSTIKKKERKEKSRETHKHNNTKKKRKQIKRTRWWIRDPYIKGIQKYMQAKTKQTKVDGESYKENLKKQKTNQKQHLNSYIDNPIYTKKKM